MRLSLTGRHVDVTPAVRQLVTRRLAKIERLLNDHALSTQVVLSLEKRHHNTEITVHARGDNLITGKGSAASWPQSLSEAVEKVMQQALKVKEKWTTRKRRAPGGRGLVDSRVPQSITSRKAGGAPMAAALTADRGTRANASNASPTTPVVRPTRYAVKPMSLEDAALRFEEAREPFVVFRHAETERINILYQRPDGRLGVIDPESE
jgi:putative sigma-54 modulation protein